MALHGGLSLRRNLNIYDSHFQDRLSWTYIANYSSTTDGYLDAAGKRQVRRSARDYERDPTVTSDSVAARPSTAMGRRCLNTRIQDLVKSCSCVGNASWGAADGCTPPPG